MKEGKMLIRLHSRPKEKDLSKELALMDLKRRYRVDLAKGCCHEMADEISQQFLKDARKIIETDLNQIMEKLLSGHAGTKAKKFIQKRSIKSTENLVRLTPGDVDSEYGFGPQTRYALQEALEKCGLRLEMLLTRPLEERATGRSLKVVGRQ